MYICIDVGGTKTLVASFTDDGSLVENVRIPTSKNYDDFLKDVEAVVEKLNDKTFIEGAIGVPAAQLDRNQGKGIIFSNLPWQNVSVVDDLKKILNCPILVENDAKMAGLYEAVQVKDKYSRVLYLTVSTGIGFAVIDNLKIDTDIGDPGGSSLPLRRGDKIVPWESLASGKSLFEKYGKLAKDIDDPEIWRSFTKDLAEGLIWLIAISQPQVVVIGGSVGAYLYKYVDFLKDAINSYNLPLIKLPQFEQAKVANDAVVYGCYEYIKQTLKNG
jgi:glucokinase